MSDEPARHYGAFDIIVVGGGTAGCLLANRLSADPRVTVLLLEAGSGRRFWHDVPLGYRYTIGRPQTDWMFETEPEAGLNGRRIPIPRGRGLGGTSLVNGMIYTRGHRRDFDRWVAAGATGWSWDEILPYFMRGERHHAGASPVHGGDGEVNVERQRAHWPFLDALAAAAIEVAAPWTDDFNGGEHEGVGWYEVTQRNGRRWDSARAFLDPAKRRSNLIVLDGALVERVLLDGGRATGVRFTWGGEPFTASAGAEVVLAAGTVQTPQILELSGIGRAELLHRAGIAPLLDLPGVGENLQDHLQIRMIYRLTGLTTLNQQLGTSAGRLAMGLRYFLARSGPLSMAPSQLGVFVRSRPEKEIADLQYHIVPYSSDKVGGQPHPFPGFTLSASQLDPASRGAVHLRSPDPRDKPAVRANYLAAEEDQRALIDAMRLGRRIMAANALAPYAPAEMRPGPQAASDADLLAVLRAEATTIFHPVGTCRMGDNAGAVVDPSLRVRGVDGLRIADASVMPFLPSANTVAATLMIAEKAADLIGRQRTR